MIHGISSHNYLSELVTQPYPTIGNQESDPVCAKERRVRIFDSQHVITISAHHCKNELETIRRSQEKLKTSLAKTKAELKAMNSRMNNTEERINDLED